MQVQVPSEREAIDHIERAAACSHELVAKETIPVIAMTELECGKMLAKADILKCSGFYDRDALGDVRGYHAERTAEVSSHMQRALDRAASLFAAATAIFLRAVEGLYTPAVVRAARAAALAQRPAFAAAEAGMNAAAVTLARTIDEVPHQPTVPRRA